jgi:hypothetical protein
MTRDAGMLGSRFQARGMPMPRVGQIDLCRDREPWFRPDHLPARQKVRLIQD